MSRDKYEPTSSQIAKIRAIGLDTNVLFKGDFSKEALVRLARQANSNEMEIWIAEPVVWEWAEHLHRSLEELTTHLKSIETAGFKVGIGLGSTSIDDSVGFVERSIRESGSNIKIISIDSVATEALKDQILARAPGERVVRNYASKRLRYLKTGASDSAIYRAYYHAANADSESYVVLSGDTDLEKAHAAWGIKVGIVKDTKILGDQVFRMVKASEVQIASCADRLKEKLTELDLTSFKAMIQGAGDCEVGPFTMSEDRILVGLYDAKFDQKAQIITAQACIMADAIGPDYDYEPMESGLEFITHQTWDYSNAALYVDVSFTLDNTNEIIEISLGTSKSLVLTELAPDPREDDGPLAILKNLLMVPRLASFDWDDNFFLPQDTSVQVDGDLLKLDFSVVEGEGWLMDAEYRGESVSVTAKVKHDDYPVKGSNHVKLSTDSVIVPNHPSFAINALIMNTPKAS